MNSRCAKYREVRWFDLGARSLVLGAIFFSSAANAQELPCNIHDFRIESATIKVFFSEKASWRVGSRGDRMIAGTKSLYFDEMQQDDVVVEEEGLTLSDGVSVNLSIPHFVCTLAAVLEQPTPGLSVSVSVNLLGIPATTNSVFLPAHRR